MAPPDENPPAAPMTGGCGCGRVRWSLSAPPVRAAYCHCTRCQRRTGTAASPSALIAPGSMTFTSGEDVLRAWAPDGGWRKWFCGACGSAVHSQHPDHPEMVTVRLGGFDGDPGVRPRLHQFVADAAPWEPLPDDGLPRFPSRPPDATPVTSPG